jgi:type I restriction enzyme S subunit
MARPASNHLPELDDPRDLLAQAQSCSLRASKDAVNQSSINQTDVKNIRGRIHPYSLQQKYADLVSRKTSSNQKLEAALKQSGNLFSSLSQRAFRGEI